MLQGAAGGGSPEQVVLELSFKGWACVLGKKSILGEREKAGVNRRVRV